MSEKTKETDPLVDIGKRIEALRVQRGMSHRDLAKAAETTGATISRTENAVTPVNLRTFILIAKALNLEPADLIRPEDESIPQAKRELLALIRGMDENEAAVALESLDVLLRGLRGQPLRPDQPSKKVKDR